MTLSSRQSLSYVARRALEGSRSKTASADSDARLSAAALLELARAKHHLRRVRPSLWFPPSPHTEVKGMSLPPEMSESSDGITDDGAVDASIIGCDCAPSVEGIPSYLLTKKNLARPAVRARLAQSIRAMTPKVRRRVIGRLKMAVALAERAQAARARVSGIVHVTPSIAGAVSGWQAANVSIGRCPYSNVAGALTP